jgi:cytochrome c biogenesis protein CcdA
MSIDWGYILSLVVLGGLADSLDPCIFALYTSILLTASVAGLRRVSSVATSFICGVYVGYLIFGSILRFMLRSFNPPSYALSALLIAFSLAMLIYTLFFEDGGAELGVCREDRVVCRIANALRLSRIDVGRYGALGAGAIGFVASLTLLPCSAGLYIAFNIVTLYMGFWSWLPLACLYTLFFIIPYVLIAIAFIGITRVPKLYSLLLERQKLIKVGACIAMIGVAIYLLLLR